MTQATASHAPAAPAHGGAHEEFEPSVPLTSGKLAMWLFLATEIMFFTGLIGSYIVLRFGSPHWPTPNTIVLTLKSEERPRTFELKSDKTSGTTGTLIVEDGDKDRTIQAADVKPLADGKSLYKHESPLAIGLTAFNTFLLICSSVSMVLALAALQKNDQTWFLRWLLITTLIGATFVSIQFVEYRELIHHGFTPATSLFASCFYVMTGCHGAHVTGGVVYLFLIFIAGLRGKYSPKNFTPVEIAGLYWHFVDLVWIILFTVVYLI